MMIVSVVAVIVFEPKRLLSASSYISKFSPITRLEILNSRSASFVKLSEFNVPVSYASVRSGAVGIVGCVRSMVITIGSLSKELLPAVSTSLYVKV